MGLARRKGEGERESCVGVCGCLYLQPRCRCKKDEVGCEGSCNPVRHPVDGESEAKLQPCPLLDQPAGRPPGASLSNQSTYFLQHPLDLGQRCPKDATFTAHPIYLDFQNLCSITVPLSGVVRIQIGLKGLRKSLHDCAWRSVHLDIQTGDHILYRSRKFYDYAVAMNDDIESLEIVIHPICSSITSTCPLDIIATEQAIYGTQEVAVTLLAQQRVDINSTTSEIALTDPYVDSVT